jgi:arsenate reductase (thioredoxin)
MKTVLFACVHNAGRSQMAAALFNRLAHPERAQAVSAGTHPGASVYPEVRTVLREMGVELAEMKPQLLTPELAAQAHLLITMGCGESCPVVPGVRREDWPLTDPKGQPLEVVRGVRDEVRDRVEALLRREGWALCASNSQKEGAL